MNERQRQVLAEAIDPAAWEAEGRRASYYRRRRAASLAAADRVFETIRRLLMGAAEEAAA